MFSERENCKEKYILDTRIYFRRNKKPEWFADKLGWTCVYLQWVSGLTFKEIISIIPADRFYMMYGAYHEMDDNERRITKRREKYTAQEVEKTTGRRIKL